MRRRRISPFSLSFLDIMFCGFGAVVLLVLILDHDTVRARAATFAELRAEAQRLEREVREGRQNLVEIRNTLATLDRDDNVAEGETERVLQRLREWRERKAKLERDTLARREHVDRLSADLESLEDETSRLGAEAEAHKAQGRKVHAFLGDGDRQYLTGLKLGGRRILILLDTSASMLDETVVNAILRRYQNAAAKRSAPKWRRALAAAEWLIANLPAAAQFQVYGFNTETRALPESSHGTWLSAGEGADVAQVVEALRRTVPDQGTSLYRAFAAARDLSPAPDNILLITDGLPTQGRYKPSAGTVSGAQRLKHLEQAATRLPRGVPLNVILLPMEGDALAPAAYWKLALSTRGAFLTPAEDWP